MARFYGKFDSGSGGWIGDLDTTGSSTGFFDRLIISVSSASGANFRDGLIASRSAVSADVYDDLDNTNIDGSKGIIFPSDTPTYPSSTLISWSNAYSSSFDGIKIPVTNTYGDGAGTINYSKRPTGSVTSSMTNIIGPVTPPDPIQLNYNVYISASNAVRNTIAQAQTGAGTSRTPFVRVGNSSSRTLHSIWNDPTLTYFAWDDFTPGAPSLTTPTDQGGHKTSGTADAYCASGQSFCGAGSPLVGFNIRVNWSGNEFANDTNTAGYMDVNFNWRNSGLVPPGDISVLAGSCTSSFIDGSPRANGTWPNFYQDYVVVLATDPPATILGDFLITASYRDPIITSSRGQYSYATLGINFANPCPPPTPPPAPSPTPSPAPPPP